MMLSTLQPTRILATVKWFIVKYFGAASRCTLAALSMPLVLLSWTAGYAQAQPGIIAELEQLSREQELLVRCKTVIEAGGSSDLCQSRLGSLVRNQRLEKALEVAKKCQELRSAGGDSVDCAALKSPVALAGALKSAAASAASSANTVEAAPEVYSYSRVGNSAVIEAALANQSKRLRIGDSIAGWRLLYLTDTVATFKKGGRTENVEFRYARPVSTLSPNQSQSQTNNPSQNTKQNTSPWLNPVGYDGDRMPAPPLSKIN